MPTNIMEPHNLLVNARKVLTTPPLFPRAACNTSTQFNEWMDINATQP